jgi:hypothetical protein
MAAKAIRFDEIRHFGPENFCSLVDGPSTRSKSTVTTNYYGRQLEVTTYYRGSKILGYQERTSSGYRYYVRVD